MRRAAAPYGSLVADLALQAASRQSAASATAAGRSPSAFCASCRRTRLADRRSLSYRSPVGNARFGPPESRREGGGAVRRLDVRHQTIREYAVVAEQVQLVDDSPQAPVSHGPMHEYDARVRAGLLRDDEHQRAIIQHLQDLHELLREYRPPHVVRPSLESLDTTPKSSFLSSLFGRKSSPAEATTQIPANLPKGLYMHGDVGCGKTMLMDLFFDTLPPNIRSKRRIHFNNFMQDVHKRLHRVKMEHGSDFDGVPFVAADIAESSSVLCFDEFQCTDVADAMILRRLLESLMSHGVVLVTTSNRHPDDLYKNGIQRQSFIPCIQLLKTDLMVLNLDSSTDYRKIPRPPSGVYHHPLGPQASQHADKWFQYLGDFRNDPPHRAVHRVWGRDVVVPQASGRAARFTFNELIGRATGAADYIELMKSYDAFIVTDVPGMSFNQRDLARRFITFIDSVYESRAKLVLTTAVPLTHLFVSPDELKASVSKPSSSTSSSAQQPQDGEEENLPDAMRALMDDLGLSMSQLKSSSIFSGDEERFAFARAISRLTEMGSKEWIERGMGMGMSEHDGKTDKQSWARVRSRWREDRM